MTIPSVTPVTPKAERGLAVMLAALAVGFNLPFGLLAARFDYPDILRQPAEVILQRFVAGGPGLVAIWYGFALAALALVPVGMAHALGRGRVVAMPGLAVAGAVAAALSGMAQAMGLLRWVMVVPGLAASGDVQGFQLIHAFGGVVVGEHLGQLLLALHVGLVAAMQAQEGAWGRAGLGALVGVTLVSGAMEAVVVALGGAGAVFGLVTVAGFAGLTLWLLWAAWGMWRV